MKIEQSTLHSEGKSLAWQSTRRHTETSLSITLPAPPTPEPPTHADFSPAGLSAQQSEALDAHSGEESADPRMQLLIAIIEALTGRKLKLFNPSELQSGGNAKVESIPGEATETATNPPAAANTAPIWSIRIETSQVHEEMERASYRAQGQIKTADGRQINFSLNLEMERYARSEHHSTFEASNAPKLKDPLVLNLGTDRVRLEAQEFSFDLNADGQAESVSRLAAGSAFLALDRNHNGKIDDGSELFGPRTGDGFAELAAFDEDGNHWIDENDAVFSKLQIWRPDELSQPLNAANIGAIALGHVATAFTLKANQDTVGLVRSTGLFLTEDGQAKTLQQIDLVV